MAELVFSKDGEILFRATLNTRSLRLGANPLNDMVLPDPDLASFQASLDRTSEGFCLTDRSGHGTTVNGKSVDNAILKHGDTIQLGKLRAVFQQEQNAPAHTSRLRKDESKAGPVFLKLDNGNRIPITELGVRVGKDESNDLLLTNSFVSGFHALVFLRGPSVVVRDLGSTNGTFINSIRISEAEAPVGATITFGQIPVLVVGPEQTSAQPRSKLSAYVGATRVGELWYADPAMEPVAAAIRSVAPHDAAVCIQGESGVGKELVAKAIHQLGPRASEPFVAVNCAALSPQLVESELFGHERGAFTGADRARMGAFEEAGKGTLFLDEVGDLPPDAQAKLLRALENREVRRVGAESTRKVQCRVVTATHQNLVQKVHDGQFRNDLFHRLTALPLRVPALRDRPKDLPLLCEYFLEEMSKGEARISPAALKKIQGHPFPGNARELKNVLLRAIVLRGKPVIEAEDIEFTPVGLEDRMEEGKAYYKGKTLAEIEEDAINDAIARTGSQVAAARELGISRSTLAARMKSRPGPGER